MTTPAALHDAIALQYAINDKFSRDRGIGPFLDAVLINSQPDPRRFGEAADPWQRELIAPKLPAIQAVAGFAPYDGPRSFLDVLPRGHDKSSLEGRIASFLLAYSRRRINGYIVAADKDQGKLVVEAMRDEAALNPWYARYLTFAKYEVTGPAGKFEVVPADAGSAFGFRGNVYILDEVTHWKDGVGQKVYDAVISGREKVPGSILVGIMNAWVKGSWQEENLIRPAFADPDEWVTFYRQGNLASWMRPERVRKVRALLPRAVAMRVLDNIPIDPVTEAGYLDPEDVAACVLGDWVGHKGRQPGYRYVLAVDYGPTKDRTVLVVLHLEPDGEVRIDEFAVWEGKDFPRGRVSIEKVNEWIFDRYKKFRPSALVFDPYQMEATIEQCENRGMPVVSFRSRAGAGNMELAMTLRNFLSTRRVRWAPSQGLVPGADDATFADELTALVTKVMSYGWRLDHAAGKHDDRAVAVGMALTEVTKFPFVAPPRPGEAVKTPEAPRPFGYEPQPAPHVKNPLLGK